VHACVVWSNTCCARCASSCPQRLSLHCERLPSTSLLSTDIIDRWFAFVFVVLAGVTSRKTTHARTHAHAQSVDLAVPNGRRSFDTALSGYVPERRSVDVDLPLLVAGTRAVLPVIACVRAVAERPRQSALCRWVRWHLARA
jgi:hypothetical protein